MRWLDRLLTRWRRKPQPMPTEALANVHVIGDPPPAIRKLMDQMAQAVVADQRRQRVLSWVRYTVCLTLDAVHGGDHDNCACAEIANQLIDRVRGNRAIDAWQLTRDDELLLTESVVRWAAETLPTPVEGA